MALKSPVLLLFLQNLRCTTYAANYNSGFPQQQITQDTLFNNQQISLSNPGYNNQQMSTSNQGFMPNSLGFSSSGQQFASNNQQVLPGNSYAPQQSFGGQQSYGVPDYSDGGGYNNNKPQYNNKNNIDLSAIKAGALAAGANVLKFKVDQINHLKAGALKASANALRLKGDLFYGGATAADNYANRLNSYGRRPGNNNQYAPPAPPTFQGSNNQYAAPSFQGNNQQAAQPFLNNQQAAQPFLNNNFQSNNVQTNSYAVGNQGSFSQKPSYNNNPSFTPFNSGDNGVIIRGTPTSDTDVNLDAPSEVDTGLVQEGVGGEQQKLQLSRLRTVSRSFQGPKIQMCEERLTQLVGDIFIGNEMVPDIIDKPPLYPLDLTYRTVRTFPGMRVTAETTRYKPILHWPAEEGALYTVVVSNLDINTRQNRSLAEFWHWLVVNIPGDSVDDGEVVFDLLFPLVLPEGNGDHRFGYFVMKQPRALDYRDEGGPTDACSPNMSKGRGPRRSTKDFMNKYGLELTAATFLIIDSDLTSLEIACKWQKCMGGQVFVRNLDCL